MVTRYLQKPAIGTATESLVIKKREQYGKIFKMQGGKYLMSIFELTHSIKINNFTNIHKHSSNSFNTVLTF